MSIAAIIESMPYILLGAVNTLLIAAAVIVLGTVGGIGAGLLRVAPWAILRYSVGAIIELIRAIPLLLQIFLIFFGLPSIGIQIPTFPAAILAMSLWMTVNTAEVVRGGVQSISKGQTEAALTTGLSRLQAMRYVVFPQAVRRMLPPYVGLCTIMIKDTSLAAIIGVFELTRAAQETIARTYQSFEIYLIVAAIYFSISYPLSRLAQRAEARLQHG